MNPSRTVSSPAAPDTKPAGAAETGFRCWSGLSQRVRSRHLVSRSVRRAAKILELKLRSLLAGGKALSGSSAAAVLHLERLHIPVRGPFVTPAHRHLFLVNECLLTEEELVALHSHGQLQPGTVASCLIRLKHDQTTSLPSPRRSQRIMLRVPLLVRTKTPDGERLRAEASTVTVNAHGGLLESHLRMSIGQRIELLNPQSGKKVACRIVSIEESSANSFSVAFEFDQRSPWFWPLSFPPLDWAAAATVA
jgi:hypothetical protein